MRDIPTFYRAEIPIITYIIFIGKYCVNNRLSPRTLLRNVLMISPVAFLFQLEPILHMAHEVVFSYYTVILFVCICS